MLDGLQWQLIGNESWAFGKVVRGIVRNRLATVSYCQVPVSRSVGPAGLIMEWAWYWSYEAGEAKTRGYAQSLEEAVNACEKGLEQSL